MKCRLFWWGLEYSPSCFCDVHVATLLQACRMNSYNYFFFWEDAEILLTCVSSLDNFFLFFFFLFAQTSLYLL